MSTISSEVCDKVMQLHSAGWSFREIAWATGISHQSAYNITKRKGMARAKRGRKLKFDQEEVKVLAQMYESGLTLLKISHMHNCSVQTIGKCITDWYKGNQKQEEN